MFSTILSVQTLYSILVVCLYLLFWQDYDTNCPYSVINIILTVWNSLVLSSIKIMSELKKNTLKLSRKIVWICDILVNPETETCLKHFHINTTFFYVLIQKDTCLSYMSNDRMRCLFSLIYNTGFCFRIGINIQLTIAAYIFFLIRS